MWKRHLSVDVPIASQDEPAGGYRITVRESQPHRPVAAEPHAVDRGHVLGDDHRLADRVLSGALGGETDADELLGQRYDEAVDVDGIDRDRIVPVLAMPQGVPVDRELRDADRRRIGADGARSTMTASILAAETSKSGS